MSRVTRSTLFRNTLAMLVGGGAQLFVQGVYFVLLARALGASQYGAFIGVVALVAILAPFSSLGTGQILVRNVARDRGAFNYSWGNALCMTSVSGSVLIGVVVLLARYALAHKVPLMLVFLVGCSDLLFAAVVGLAGLAFQAVEELHRTAQVAVVLTGARAICAVVLLLSIGHPTALSWGFFYCLSSLVGGVYGVALVCSRLGYPVLSVRRLRSELLEGFYFAISVSAQSVYTSIDKTMLVRLATLGAAGIYGAAFRLVDLAFQPIAALSASAYARFFKHGRHGLRGTTSLAKRLLPFALGYAFLACVVLIFVAPVLPVVLGRDFRGSVATLRWLSPLLLFRAIHYFLSSSLTGADLQGLRSGIQIIVAGLNVLLNLWLIPALSWRGAAFASLASEGALALGMFVAVAFLSRRQPLVEAGCEVEPRVIL